AGLGVDEFDPPVAAALEDGQRSERRLGTAGVEPGQQFLKMHINGKRSGLIDHPKARAERGDQDTASASVAVAGIAIDVDEHPRILLRTKGGVDRLPIGAEVLEKL